MDTRKGDNLKSAPAPERNLSSRFRRWGGEWVLLVVILALAALFRFQGLKEFSQVGGDDVEFRVHVPDHVRVFEYILRKEGCGFPRLKAPFIAAVYLSHLDVNKKVTSFAKPFFLLEVGILQSIIGLDTGEPSEDIWRFHQWMAWLGVATVAAIFFLGRRLSGSGTGLAASFLLAVSPWAVRYSTWGLHVVGGGFWLVLALLVAARLGRRDTFLGNVLFGALISVCIYYSTSMIWPALFLFFFEIIHRVFLSRAASRGFRYQTIRFIGFIAGCLLPILLWEAVNATAGSYLEDSVEFVYKLSSSRYLDLKKPYTSFPGRLVQTIRDNAANTGSLPVDHLYFWRHLKDSEGWIVTVAVLVSLVAGMILVVRRRFKNGISILRLIFVFIGVTFVMNYTSGTQVARHYFSAGLIGFVLVGVMTAKLKNRRPAAACVLPALGIVVAALHFHHLEAYRASRQGPYLVERWERENELAGQLATMSMQQWDLWPTMSFLRNWDDYNQFVTTHPRAHIMYSDYIGIAHGSWFYHNMTLLNMAETFRRCREMAFITDSYLSYQPMLYENEFYYWGLYRLKSPYFDPRIKVIPVQEVARANRELREEVTAEHELFARLKKDPPVIIPAWRNYRILPYMDKMRRPSYLLHGIISGALLLAFTVFVLARNHFSV